MRRSYVWIVLAAVWLTACEAVRAWWASLAELGLRRGGANGAIHLAGGERDHPA